MLSRLSILVRKTGVGNAPGSKNKAAENLTQLIDKAQKSVYIVCGGLNPSVYDDPALIEAVRRAKSEPRNVQFHVLVGPKWKTRNSEMKDLLTDSTTVAKKRPPLHFAVVDNRRVRYEGVHQVEEPVPANDILHNAPKTAEKLIRIYYDLISDEDNIEQTSEPERQDC